MPELCKPPTLTEWAAYLFLIYFYYGLIFSIQITGIVIIAPLNKEISSGPRDLLEYSEIQRETRNGLF